MLRRRSLRELSRDEQDKYERLITLSDNLEILENEPDKVKVAEQIRKEYEQEVEELMRKVEHIADFIVDMEESADAARIEINRLLARELSFLAKAKRLKEYVMHVMETRGTDRLETPLVTLERRLNPESVEILSADLIPDEYKRTVAPPTPQPDKTKIKDALKSGKDVAGAKLVRRPRLVMK